MRKGNDIYDIAEHKHIMRVYHDRLARRDFVAFLSHINTNYQTKWFHKLIAINCQRLVDGEIKNLMVFMPPQHGKSEIISRNFPAWALGKNPDLKIAGCSYAGTLANSFSMNIQRTISSVRYQGIFPSTQLSGMNQMKAKGFKRNEDYFDIVGHAGFYKAVGVGGGLTGTPVDIAIIDDPVKDALEAQSPVYRQRVWEWYNTVLTTRLHNNSRQLFIMTRWHEDDLAGRILKAEPDEWTVLSIPAICEVENDGELNSKRHIGDPLWPEKHSLEKLLKQKERSARQFSALYQQSPSADGGNIVKREWFKHISLAEFNRIHNQEPIIFFIDTAYTDKTSNDPSGIICTCKVGNDLYITHAQKVYKEFPAFIRFIPEYVREHGYGNRSTIRIEPKANGLSVLQQIKAVTSLNVARTPTPSESKETRLNAASPSIECGRVILVDGAWNEEFTEEVCGFPVKPHDEYVDCLCYAVDYHLTHPLKPIDRQRISRLVY